MLVIYILTLSVLLQFVAAIMAFRLIPLTGRRLAWSLISAALMLMALRRCITLIHSLSGETITRPDLNAELIALAISLIMAVGISRIAPIFTDSKRAEAALQESEERYRTVADFAYAWEYWLAPDGKYVFVSPACERISGYRTEEFYQNPNLLEKIIHPDDKSRFACHLQDVLQGKSDACELEFRIVARDGQERWIGHVCQDVHSLTGVHLGRRSSNLDITERKRAEKALKASEEKHRTLFESSRDAIMTLEPPSWRFTSGNPATVEMFAAGDEVSFIALGPWELSPEFQPDGRPSSEKAAEMIQTAMAEGSKFFKWTHRRRGGESFPAAVLLTRMEIGGNILLQATVRDITEQAQAEEKLLQTLESLRKALGTTIQVMVSAIEVRDPYTAGHQIRSTDLARAIATEMGLSQDTIEAIRMAGPIHDIGKLSIPAEILSKPTKLTNIEFSLIKEHAQTGYEMLKDVESPWPLAEIVYQHHERMDGSGYPRNLKGDDILMEARIMAVADVVESMASHRPYRPALGLNAALEEIENNKGTLYDADAVDACLRLFREKGYQL